MALADLVQHVASRAAVGPEEGSVAAKYPEGFFSDAGTASKSSVAQYVAQTGTGGNDVDHPELGRSKTLPHKLSMTRFDPIEINPAALIDTNRNGTHDSLQRTNTL